MSYYLTTKYFFVFSDTQSESVATCYVILDNDLRHHLQPFGAKLINRMKKYTVQYDNGRCNRRWKTSSRPNVDWREILKEPSEVFQADSSVKYVSVFILCPIHQWYAISKRRYCPLLFTFLSYLKCIISSHIYSLIPLQINAIKLG